MGAGRPLTSQLHHLDAKGRQQDRRGRIGHRRAIGRILHRLEIRAHRGQRTLVLMSTSVHQRHVADTDAEDEAARPGFGQRSGSVDHRRRVPDPDVGDSGGDRDLAGGGKDQGAGGKRLTANRLSDPDRPETHRFDLGDRLAKRRSRQVRHRAQPDAGRAQIQACAGCRVCSRMKSSICRQASSDAALCWSNFRSKNEWGAPSYTTCL